MTHWCVSSWRSAPRRGNRRSTLSPTKALSRRNSVLCLPGAYRKRKDARSSLGRAFRITLFRYRVYDWGRWIRTTDLLINSKAPHELTSGILPLFASGSGADVGLSILKCRTLPPQTVAETVTPQGPPQCRADSWRSVRCMRARSGGTVRSVHHGDRNRFEAVTIEHVEEAPTPLPPRRRW